MSTFTSATSITPLNSHTYTALFPQDWCIGSVPHGGYVTSCFLSVASLHFRTTLASYNQPHTLTLHLEFLRRSSTGPATFTVRDVKLGRQTSIIHIALTQNSSSPREEVVGYITNSNIAAESGVSLPTNWSLSPASPPVKTAQLANDKDPHWKRQPHMPFPNFRKASRHVQFFFPRNGQLEKSLVDEWIRFSNGDKFTMDSLGYVVDMWPQVVEAYRGKDPQIASPASTTTTNQEQKQQVGKDGIPPKSAWANFWYPTLLLNLEVKKVLPPEGVEWLFVRVRAKQIKNGRLDLEVIVLDEGGDIVALSSHVALILGAERNMAERKEGPKDGKL